MTRVLGGAELPTVTLTASEVLALPTSSVARAVSVCAPFTALVVFHAWLNGAVVSVATVVPSTRNSTCSTRRSSVAAAASSTVSFRESPGPGEDRLTVGACETLPSAKVIASLGRRFGLIVWSSPR